MNERDSFSQTRQEQSQTWLERLRLIDDEFFSEALDGKIEAVQYIIDIILERTDLRVISVQAQASYKNTTRRSIRLDIRAEMQNGQIADIEIQRADAGSGARRARFYNGMIDRTLLNQGADFQELPDIYIIFITENDKYGCGAPLYHVERTVCEAGQTLYGDGAHIIYVNGQFRNIQHPVGRLMHDFFCTRAEDMLSPVLAAEVRYLKETERGQGQMSRIMEEVMHNDRVETARQMLAEGDSPEKVSRCTRLPLEEVQELAGEKSA